jgi:hypothetical protein
VLRQAGKTVALKDWDAQGTSNKSLEMIHGHRPESISNPDIVIWDTPPSLDHTATATAVRSANLALAITTLPRPTSGKPKRPFSLFVSAMLPRSCALCSMSSKRQRRLVEESAKQGRRIVDSATATSGISRCIRIHIRCAV